MRRINAMFAPGLLALALVLSAAQQQARADEPVVLTEQEILAQIIGNTAIIVGGEERWSDTTNRTEPFEGVRNMAS